MHYFNIYHPYSTSKNYNKKIMNFTKVLTVKLFLIMFFVANSNATTSNSLASCMIFCQRACVDPGNRGCLAKCLVDCNKDDTSLMKVYFFLYLVF